MLLYAQTKKLLLHTVAHRCAARLLPYRQWVRCRPGAPRRGKAAAEKMRENRMFNVIIFLLGAGIMFFMALRSVLARRRLCTQGQKVTATVEGTVQSRDGGAYVLAFTTAGGSHRLHYPKPARGKSFAVGDTVTLYYDPDAPEKMYVEGDRATLGAEVLYAVLGVTLLVLTVGIAR